MARYNLQGLGSQEFEQLVQALLKKIIGSGTVTFGAGKDGAREATYSGPAPYPSSARPWSGEWVFQAKFHDIDLIGVEKARKQVLADLEAELGKITEKYQIPCDNFVLVTNVPLTPAFKTGNMDRIRNDIVPKYHGRIKNIAIWGSDEVCRFLDADDSVRNAYLHFIAPGDLIASLLRRHQADQNALERTIQAYLRAIYNREQYAQLDQAGDVSDTPVKLQNVFFDLSAKGSDNQSSTTLGNLRRQSSRAFTAKNGEPSAEVVQLMLSTDASKVVLLGGPGEGKSTLGQYLAQLHRATLLQCVGEIAINDAYIPSLPRIPLRVILKDYGQWIAGSGPHDQGHGSLDRYICEQIEGVTSRSITPNQLHEIVERNPTLLILDGLDEVTDSSLRKTLLERIREFADRCEKVLQADLQVLATTRPTGYAEQFNPNNYLHLRLLKLAPSQVTSYVARWCIAKNFDESKSKRINVSIEECLSDRQISLLATTPLQVTILALIISSGGTPPRQREALFNEYLEVMYKRETAKGRHIIQSEKELLVGLHKYIGFVLHEDATRADSLRSALPADAYRQHVAKFLSHIDPYSPEVDRKAELKAITREAGERLVLIVEPVEGEFGFELRSVQEFFAACHLADTSKTTEQRYQRFEAISRLAHWRNVALFFAGRVGRNYPGEAGNFLEVLRAVDREAPDNSLRRGCRLALELAADRAFGPNRRGQRSLLEQGMLVLERELTKAKRDEVCDTLQRLPAEDIRDHVAPILLDRIDSLDPALMPNMIFAGHSVNLPEVVERASKKLSSAAKMKQACLELVLEIGPSKMRKYISLSSLVRELLDEQIINAFVSAVWGSVAEAVEILVEDRFDSERLLGLVGEVVSWHDGPNDGYGGSASEVPAWDPSWAPENPLSLLAAFCAVRYVSEVRFRRKGLLGTTSSSWADELLAVREVLPCYVLSGDLGFTRLGEGRASHWLNYWVLHIWFGDTTGRTLEDFADFWRSSAHSEQMAEQGRIVRVRSPTPSFDLACSASMANVMNEHLPVILEYSGHVGISAWQSRLQEVAQALDSASVQQAHGERTNRRALNPEGVLAVIDERSPGIVGEYVKRNFLPVQQLAYFDDDAVVATLNTGLLTRARFDTFERRCEFLGNALASKDLILRAVAEIPAARPQLWELLALAIPAVLNVDRDFPDALLMPALSTYGKKLEAGVSHFGWDDFGPLLESHTAERLLRIAGGRTPSPARSAAADIIRRYCGSYAVYKESVREELPRPRFKGLAELHRGLVESADSDVRELGLVFFSVRYPVSGSDFMLLRRFMIAENSVEAAERLVTISRLAPGSVRLRYSWCQMLQQLLEVPHLKPAVAAALGSELERLLTFTSQSLGDRQEELGLPLQIIH